MKSEIFENWCRDPENSDLLYQVGEIFYKERNYAGAISTLLKCSETTKDKNIEYDCLISIGYLYLLMESRDLSSESYLHNAIKLMPLRIDAYILLADIYLKRDSWCFYYDRIIYMIIFLASKIGSFETSEGLLKVFEKNYTMRDFNDCFIAVAYRSGNLEESYALAESRQDISDKTKALLKLPIIKELNSHINYFYDYIGENCWKYISEEEDIDTALLLDFCTNTIKDLCEDANILQYRIVKYLGSNTITASNTFKIIISRHKTFALIYASLQITEKDFFVLEFM